MRAIGVVFLLSSGAAMYLFEIYWFYQWWGGTGLLIAVMAAPVSAIFPFIYLLREGFSALYFGTWAVGILGIILLRLTDKESPETA